MGQRGEVGEREATEGRELFLLAGRGWRRWESTGKAPHPKSSWRESGKVETVIGTEKKGRKEKGDGLNSIKTINRGSAESETPQLNTWRCSGGKGKSLEVESKV